MKVKKKLSPLIICLIILSALLLIIAFFVLSKEKVDLKPDSDTSYYNSYEYGCNSMRIYNGKRFPMSDDYMVYKDGNLYVKDPIIIGLKFIILTEKKMFQLQLLRKE